MKLDQQRVLFSYLIAILILSGVFYALVINKYELTDLTAGALISIATLAANWVFNSESVKQASAAAQRAFDQGLGTPVPAGTTVTPPKNGTTTTTVTSEPPPPDIGGQP